MTDPIHELLQRLSGIPARIASAVANISDASKHAVPPGGEWSASQILAHLRASDDILAHRLYAILTRENPALPAYDERRWAESRLFRSRFRAIPEHLHAAPGGIGEHVTADRQ